MIAKLVSSRESVRPRLTAYVLSSRSFIFSDSNWRVVGESDTQITPMSNQQRIRFLQRRWSSPVEANLRICGELGRLVRRELRRGRGRLRLRRDDVALLSSDLVKATVAPRNAKLTA